MIRSSQHHELQHALLLLGIVLLGCSGQISSSNEDGIIFEKWLREPGKRAWGYQSELWYIKEDGTGLRRLTAGFRDLDPAWSPDRKKIVFTRGESGIWTLDLEGRSLRHLVQASPVLGPQWLSEDKVIYSSIPQKGSGNPLHRWRFFIYSSHDDVPYMLPIEGLVDLTSAHVSPDREWLVFRAIGEKGTCVYLARVRDIQKSTKPILTEDVSPLMWLPDSSGFLIQEGNFYTVVDLSGITRPMLPSFEASPFISWSPDGSALAVIDLKSRLSIVSRDGGVRRVIAEPSDDGIFTNPVWLN